MALIPHDVGPQQVNVNNNQVQIKWNDGHLSCFDSSWLKANAYDGSQTRKRKSGLGSIADESNMLLWDKDKITSNPPRNFTFDQLKNDPKVLPSLLENLHRFGFIFVDDTPLDDECVSEVCELIGGFVQETIFGRVYVLSNRTLTHADIAYLNPALNAHTDQTYFACPVGLQAMHVTHHDGTGGLSLLVDGFKAAKDLYKEDPEAYEILTSTRIPFEYISKGHVLRNYHVILDVDPGTNELLHLRYNNTRVGSLAHLPYKRMEKFYRAIRSFGSILQREENELWFKLTPGRVIVMDNRRVLHGRSEITGSRKLVGGYVCIDNYMGSWRAMKLLTTDQ
ncbi:trimethyllysine dioxygenase, mitochondrial [Exaiptasia diaphana]|uniref:TauD/TfdA-like domain-containing protein n=1 Tax=Exaiptasia diaphana TaxID=2652724 RepID=A0A913YWK5_EXADI|nr:trimethyllysine dioxygenase, mitochondrial [Exaiptasia diaphana]